VDLDMFGGPADRSRPAAGPEGRVDSGLETVADKVGDPISCFDPELQLRVSEEKVGQLRGQNHTGKQRIDIDPQSALDCLPRFRCLSSSLTDPDKMRRKPARDVIRSKP
jgi:hypothetical protein